MPVTLYAILLLTFRFVSVWLIIDVLRKQRQFRRLPIDKSAPEEERIKAAILREQMYTTAVVILGINFVPIAIDILSIAGITTRGNTIPYSSVIYMFSYAFGTLLLTFMIWRIYKNALK